MKAGAVEFLTKPFGDEVLLSAIRHAIERSHTALAHGAEIRALRDRHASLSRREREVMALVVSGLMNKQGGELGTSETTVKAHQGKVTRKMQANSLAVPGSFSSRTRTAKTIVTNPRGPNQLIKSLSAMLVRAPIRHRKTGNIRITVRLSAA
jgi:DNA-binding NarL/FixJ family response regulator